MATPRPAVDGGLADDTFERVRRRFGRLLAMLAIPQAALVAIYRLLPEDPEGPGTALAALMIWASFVVSSSALGAVAVDVTGAQRGAAPSFARVVGRTLAALPRLIVTHLLTVMLLAPALMLIVPGVFFAIRFAFAPLAVALDGSWGMDALRESRSRVERGGGGALGLPLANAHILIVIYLVQNLPATWGMLFTAWVASTLVGAFTTTATALRWERRAAAAPAAGAAAATAAAS